MYTRFTYAVAITHPTRFHAGTKELTVSRHSDSTLRFVSGEDFGCSRDYDQTDDGAIRAFMREHMCTVVSIRLITVLDIGTLVARQDTLKYGYIVESATYVKVGIRKYRYRVQYLKNDGMRSQRFGWVDASNILPRQTGV